MWRRSLNRPTTLFDYLDKIPQVLSSPFGLAALAILLGLVCVILFNRYGVYLGIGMLLFTGIVNTGPGVEGMESDLALIGPLETFRSVAKALFVLLAFVLAARALLIEGKTGKPFNGAVIGWLALQGVYALRFAVAGAWDRAILNFSFGLVLAVGIVGTLSRIIREMREIHRVFLALEISGLFFCGLSLVQWRINPAPVLHGSRMQGLSENPQFAGVLMSTLVCICIYLALSKTESLKKRLFHFACIIVFGSFLMWTGSRTAVLITAVGAAIQVRGKIMAWIGILLAGYVAFLLLGSSAGESSGDLMDRLISLQNTRAEAWARSWDAFLANILFGDGRTLLENSYLSAAASMGLLGVAVLGAMIIAHGRSVFYVFMHRQWLGGDARLAYLVVALTAALGAGAMFEPFLLSIATHATVTLLVLAAVAEAARDRILAAEYAGMPLQEALPEITPNLQLDT